MSLKTYLFLADVNVGQDMMPQRFDEVRLCDEFIRSKKIVISFLPHLCGNLTTSLWNSNEKMFRFQSECIFEFIWKPNKASQPIQRRGFVNHLHLKSKRSDHYTSSSSSQRIITSSSVSTRCPRLTSFLMRDLGNSTKSEQGHVNYSWKLCTLQNHEL